MAVIRLQITVDDIATVIGMFDQIKVYRSTAGVGGPFPELTTVGTRIALVAGQALYTFDDTAGDASYYYKTSFFNSTSSLESSLSDAIQGDVDPLYVSLQDIRDEGVSVAQADDSRVLTLLRTWQAFIERTTRQFFVPRNMTLDFDGNGTTLLPLPVPVISVANLFVNDDFVTAVSTSDYQVYNGRGESERDDRKNPRIKLITSDVSVFTGVGAVRRRRNVFEVGEKNQRVVGTFGYVEPDGCVPFPIQHVLKKLVVKHVAKLSTVSGAAGGPLIEEETDRHRRKFGDATTGAKLFPLGTGDPECDLILAQYRAPISVRAPRTLFRRMTGGRVLV